MKIAVLPNASGCSTPQEVATNPHLPLSYQGNFAKYINKAYLINAIFFVLGISIMFWLLHG